MNIRTYALGLDKVIFKSIRSYFELIGLDKSSSKFNLNL